jgi:putative SOS response-associated peptidase YedK
MCGRFTLTTPEELIAEAFGLDAVPRLGARYNIAPGQPMALVRQAARAGSRALSLATWGFLPAATEGDSSAAAGRLINARSETAATRPAFREAFRSRRCLVPADGFYEWRRGGGRREAFHFRRRDRGAFAFAGLFDVAPGSSDACAGLILTTEPNDLVCEIHDRMPVILRPEDYARWLDPSFHDVGGLRHVLAPYPAWQLESVRVGPAVNSVANDGPECLEPPRQASLFDL